MSHIDPDTLALVAMSELEPTPAERRHLATCDACAAELASLARTASVGRASAGVSSVAPSPELWLRIRAELGLDGGTAGDGDGAVAGAAGPSGEPATPIAPVTPTTSPRESQLPVELREPVELHTERGRRRGGRRWLPVVAAAAIVGLVGGLGIGAWLGTTSTPSGAVIARAVLDPFPGWPDARGSAVVEELPDGSRQVVVDVDRAVTTASDADPLREVWLIAGDASGLVSIGFLDGTSGRFAVPAGLDLAVYSQVDVSAEPDNGDPAHSGDSIVRGPLRQG